MRTTPAAIVLWASGCAAPACVAGLRATPAKAAVRVVHGLKDHSDRREGFAQELVEHGAAVHALD